MNHWTRRWMAGYWLAVVVLAFGVAWSLYQVIELHDRADRAEEAVQVLTDRAPRMPQQWRFDIRDGSILDCERIDAEPVYMCFHVERDG